MESFSKEIPYETLPGLGPLILLKSNFPEFSNFRALKIGLQHPSWCQTTSTGLVCSIPESVIIFLSVIKSQLLFSLKRSAKKIRYSFQGHPVQSLLQTSNLSLFFKPLILERIVRSCMYKYKVSYHKKFILYNS